MERCFVIQPFDNGNFDKRFKDIFKPAIEKANFEAYRIDNDLSVTVPIEDIEKGISESTICFAEISTDNPNVWYELGFAFACEKDVIMVCSEDRIKFPFDIQHKSVIRYKTGSKSDFEELEDTITKKLLAVRHKIKSIDLLSTTPVVKTEGLNSHEIALLILVTENSVNNDDATSVSRLTSEMIKAGYTSIAANIAFRTLAKYEMILLTRTADEWSEGQDYFICRLTDSGEQWILSNQHLLQFRKDDFRMI